MDAIFLAILNMSFAASWLAVAVFLLRFAFKKAPKWMNCVLWAFVGLRLLLPFSLESVLSLIPSAETISPDILYAQQPEITSGISAINNAINPVFSGSFAPETGESVNPVQIWIAVAAAIWLAGIAVMLIYAAVSYLRMWRRVRVSLPVRGNIRICDDISTPFLLGIWKPRIYLPSGIEKGIQTQVIAHEEAHLKRGDHLWKPLGFLILAIHWFNPVIWLAYMLFCHDIELACDEKVIRHMKKDDMIAYSEALYACNAPRRYAMICPLAFGEVGVKERIKTVLNYKKPALWIFAAAIAVCVIIAICFLTNPVGISFDFENQITSAVSLDHRSGEEAPLKRALNQAEIEELVSRLKGVSKAKKSSGYAGMTPLYQIAVELKNGARLQINGYSTEKKQVGLEYENDRYTITDSEFCAYLSRACAGENTALAEETTDIHGSGGTMTDDPLEGAVTAAILEENGKPSAGKFTCESHVILQKDDSRTAPNGNQSKNKNRITLYAMVLYQEYGISGGAIYTESGSHIPTVMTFDVSENGAYTLAEYWIPRDGSYYAPDIREKFPPSIAEDAMDTQKYILGQMQQCYAQAAQNMPIDTDTVIDGLLKTICSSPTASSNPGDYIDAHSIEYRELTFYGNATLRYCFAQFEKGGQTDLRGHIMARVCETIAMGYGQAFDSVAYVTGQNWYDAFKQGAVALQKEYSDDEMKKMFPASFLLLQFLAE